MINAVNEVLNNPNLGGDLCSAENSGKRTCGIMKYLVYGPDFALHHISEHLILRKIICNKRRGGVSSVCRTESIVDIAVCIGGKFGNECFLTLFDRSFGRLFLLIGSIISQPAGFTLFFCIKTEVFQ